MKKLIALVLCVSMLLCLGACGKSKEDATSSQEASSQNTSSVVTQGEPAGDDVSQEEGTVNEEGSVNEEDKDVYAPGAENITTDNDLGISYVNNVINVMFQKNTSQADIDAVVKALGGSVVSTVDGVNLYQINVGAKTLEQLDDLVSLAEKNACVSFAYYDRAYKADDTLISAYLPNDPWAGDVDEADCKDGDVDGSNWWLEAIDAYGAWEYSDYFSTIKLGIVDDGFDARHEDLKVSFPGLYRLLNSRSDHGSHVAGIIGAKGDNNKGITGIAQNSELICFDWSPNWWQELLFDWKTDTMIYSGLIKTVQSGAKVVNFSLGMAGNAPNGLEYHQSIIDAEGKKASGYMAALLEDYDFVVVQAAGNGAVDAKNAGMFASVTPQNCVDYGTGRTGVQEICDRIIVVAAAQQNGSGYMVTEYSCGGGQVDIAAPGGDASGTPEGDIYSCVVNGYAALAGTSMAAPMVTAVAGLVWSANGDLTGNQVAKIVCSNTQGTAIDNPRSLRTGNSYGMLNAKKAVEAALVR